MTFASHAVAPHRAFSRAWRDNSVMFLMCFCGMAIGFAIDLQNVLPQTIGSLCGASHGLRDSIVLHATLLPATNLLMLAGGVVASGLMPALDSGHDASRAAPIRGYFVCGLTMLTGMFVCEWLGPQVARTLGLSWNVSAMMSAMTIGMASGMAPVIILPKFAKPFSPTWLR